MNPRVILVALLLLQCFSAFAVTSGDAVNFVVNSNNFLFEGETYSPPNVALEFEEKEYWVIPLTSGSKVTTYFPVEVESGEISISRATNRGVFEVADNLRNLQELKASISANPGVEWVFTQQYKTIFSEMALQLNDEIFQLNTVETTLKDEGMNVNLSALKSQLSKMSKSSSDLSEKISVASAAENDFVARPSLQSFEELKDSFESVFSSIDELNSDALTYISDVDKFKQQISVANIDAQTKSQLFSILSVPESIKSLRDYNSYSSQIKETFDSLIKDSGLVRDSLLDELENRFEKNTTYVLIWGDNEKLDKNSRFPSLFEAYRFILNEENKPLWENQVKVRSFEDNYSRAERFYNERNFERSQEYALKAIDDAIAIDKAGSIQNNPNTSLFSQDQLFLFAGILIAGLVVLYLINNRGKLGGMIQGKGDEIDVYK
ncbi:MAG TPA: hypothetical protein VFF13_06850 [archaeon]|nr:hypothetical protein [archaeon]